jgi:hypothetical protein
LAAHATQIVTVTVGAPAPPPSPPPLVAKIKLSGDIVTIQKDQAQFESAFKRDLAAALRVTSARIQVLSVSAGSVLVEFKVDPPPVSGSTAAEPSTDQVLTTMRSMSQLGNTPVLGPVQVVSGSPKSSGV